jgi:chlorite dismutase
VSGSQPPRLYTFAGGDSGAWRIVRSTALAGEPLPEASRLAIIPGGASSGAAKWRLRGVTSNERYVTRAEKSELIAKQQGLGRPDSGCAALIPIRKTAAWWALPQDERRRIFEESSRHVRIGLKYLPAVARRLHHCRDLGESEPFDFLTWFEYAPADAAAFDALVAELRASEEWSWVEREIDIRVVRAGP